MKAIVKADDKAASLFVKEVPRPGAGEDWVLVKVHSCGICYTDASIVKNQYIGRKPVPVPIVLGHEAAGEIVETGPGAGSGRVGERVALEPTAGSGRCRECLNGHRNLCSEWEHIGITRNGAFAEYIALPSVQAHRITGSVGYDVASLTEPFGLVVRTFEQVNPILGETAAIVGPGSIGLLHLLAFKAAGLSKVIMIGTDRDAKRFALAERLGADCSFSIDNGDAAEAVRDLTGGAGADIVVETASSPKAVNLAMEVAAPRGRVSLFGLYPGADFSPVQMLRKGLTVFGDVAQVTRHFMQALRIIASQRIDFRPILTHKLSLDEAEQAFEATRIGDAVKVVIEPQRKISGNRGE